MRARVADVERTLIIRRLRVSRPHLYLWRKKPYAEAVVFYSSTSCRSRAKAARHVCGKYATTRFVAAVGVAGMARSAVTVSEYARPHARLKCRDISTLNGCELSVTLCRRENFRTPGESIVVDVGSRQTGSVNLAKRYTGYTTAGVRGGCGNGSFFGSNSRLSLCAIA